MNASVSLPMLTLTALVLSCTAPAAHPQWDSHEDDLKWVPAPDEFASARAWSDLRALSLAKGSGEARAHLRASLSTLGLRVEERITPVPLESGDSRELVHLEARLPGESDDRFVLLAPYGGPAVQGAKPGGGSEALSGAALLLELTRALSERRLPYSTQVFFLESSGSPARSFESQLLAASMAEHGEFEGIRLLVVFDRVCRTDLRIARDLRSQRHHREHFWSVARELGHAATFPTERSLESVEAIHRPFAEMGLRPVLAIVDSGYRATETRGDVPAVQPPVPDGCVAESLGAVGAVSLASLLSIGEQLERIDRFIVRSRVADNSLTAAVSPPSPSDPEHAP